jgi:hypothetical protein
MERPLRFFLVGLAIGITALAVLVLVAIYAPESKAGTIQAGAAVAGVFVTLVGFYYVVKQLEQTRIAVQSQNRWAIEQVSCELYSMFVQSDGIYKYFHDNVAFDGATTKEERVRALAAAELMIDYFETIVESEEAVDRSTRYAWRIYMKQMYEQSPVLRDFLKRERHRYTPGLTGWLIDGKSRAELCKIINDKQPRWEEHFRPPIDKKPNAFARLLSGIRPLRARS